MVFFRSSLDERFVDSSLGFGAGLMVYVSFLELLAPSIDARAVIQVLLGFLFGLVLMKSLDVIIPHTRLVHGGLGGKYLLIAAAIALHNIPEGIAVGSASIYRSEVGLATSIAIALQDLPEGLIVAVAVVAATGKRLLGFAVGILSAVMEYVSAFTALIGMIEPGLLLPLLMSLSASAMVYVVIHEVAPEIFGHEHDEFATAGFVAGLLIGLLLDLF